MPNLYVTEPGAQVEKEGGQILVTRGGEVLAEVPAARLEQVVLVGPVGVTTPALHFLLERRIGLVLLGGRGQLRGRLATPLGKNVDLRQLQYSRAAEPDSTSACWPPTTSSPARMAAASP